MHSLIAGLFLIASALQAGTVSPAPSAAAIDSAIRVHVDSGFAGVVLVEYRGRLVLKRAYNSPASRLNESSAFWIGSITKEFTAGVVMKLAGKRLISLEDSVGNFVPNAPAETRGITIRQLLTHTSGIDANFAASSRTDRDSAVKAILSLPLYAKPGTSYRYNDDDYVLLAAIAEIVSGRKWETLVRDLTKPAGMHQTGFWNGPQADWGHKGANGMSSSSGDLLRWIHALRQGSALTPRQVRAIEGPQVFVRRSRDEDVYYGFGTRVYQRGGRTTEVFHSGSSDDGNTAVVRELANGLTIIVLSNAGQHGGTTWSSYVAQHLPVQDR